MNKKYLLDLGVVVALTDLGHADHRKAREWFNTVGGDRWGICSLTEMDFLQVAANRAVHPGLESLEYAKAVLQTWRACTGFIRWPIPSEESWINLTACFAQRVFGYRQIKDAYLLGLAIKGDGALVTFDQGIKYLAGAEFHENVRILG